MMLQNLIDALQDTLDNEGDMPVYGCGGDDAERFEIEEIQVDPKLEIAILRSNP